VTVVHTLAASYVSRSALQAGSAAAAAEDKKSAMYCSLWSSHIFIPVAVESLGPLTDNAHHFLNEIGKRISLCTGIREKLPSCTSASQLRFSVLTPNFI